MIYVLYVLKHAKRADSSTISIFVKLLMQEERIKRSRDRVVAGEWSVLSLRAVRAAVCDFIKSHDEIRHPWRRSECNFWRCYWEKKAEISTNGEPLFTTSNESTLFDRASSPERTIADSEMMELRSSTRRLRRQICRMVPCAARSRSA